MFKILKTVCSILLLNDYDSQGGGSIPKIRHRGALHCLLALHTLPGRLVMLFGYTVTGHTKVTLLPR
jgi:hypothetical protein